MTMTKRGNTSLDIYIVEWSEMTNNTQAYELYSDKEEGNLAKEKSRLHGIAQCTHRRWYRQINTVTLERM